MNKILNLLLFILFSNCINSQSFNLSFEELDEKGNPKNWIAASYARNSAITSDAYHGKNAVGINNGYGYVSGRLYLGSLDQKIVASSEIGDQGSLGLPIQEKVHSLKGWYKYEQIAPNRLEKDSAQVIIILRRFLESEQKSVIVGQGLLNLGAKDQYTEFQVPIKYLRDLLPDTVSIFFCTVYDQYKLKSTGGVEAIFLPNRQQCGQLGLNCFYLTIDNLSLQFTTPTKNPATQLQKLQISPNPAQDQAIITWEVPDHAKVFNLKITDALGRTVRNIQTAQNQAEVKTEDLPKGIYLVFLRQGGQLMGVERLVVAR